MLDIMEKALWILTGMVVLAAGAWLLLVGPPSSRPWLVTRSESVTAKVFSGTLNEESRQKLDVDRQRLKKEGPRRTEHFRAVNEAMADKVSNRTDALKEAKKASSELKTNKDGSVTLIIKDFGEQNLFEKLGFQENDEIENVNGLPLDVSEFEAWQAFDELSTRFERGEPIYVELKRNGRPITLWFGPDSTWPGSGGQ